MLVSMVSTMGGACLFLALLFGALIVWLVSLHIYVDEHGRSYPEVLSPLVDPLMN